MYCERKISASMRERKQLRAGLQVKSVDAEGRFAGYASIFDVVDNQRDIILHGAFYQTLQRNMRDIKLLWQHRQDEPIGVIEQIFEDSHGLYIQGRLLKEVRRAQEALALLQAGALKGLSIGYSPVRYRIDPDTGVRLLAEVDLWEVSLVTFPANEAAQVTVVKQVVPVLTSHEISEWERAVKTGQALELASALERAARALF